VHTRRARCRGCLEVPCLASVVVVLPLAEARIHRDGRCVAVQFGRGIVVLDVKLRSVCGLVGALLILLLALCIIGFKNSHQTHDVACCRILGLAASLRDSDRRINLGLCRHLRGVALGVHRARIAEQLMIGAEGHLVCRLQLLTLLDLFSMLLLGALTSRFRLCEAPIQGLGLQKIFAHFVHMLLHLL